MPSPDFAGQPTTALRSNCRDPCHSNPQCSFLRTLELCDRNIQGAYLDNYCGPK